MYRTYCESPALSISTPGVVYKAIEVPENTPVISNVDIQNLLDVLCCFYDFSNNKPESNNELRVAWDKAKDKQQEMSGCLVI